MPHRSAVAVHDHASKSAQSIKPAPVKVKRARSVASARPFRIAVFFCSLHYLGILATMTSLTCVIVNPKPEAVRIMIAAIIFSAVTWLIAFFKRRSTFCPLCKGTPLVNSGAMVHIRAWRIHPLNHGVTATLSIMATQKFRCMYCGTDYDLLKPRRRLLEVDVDCGESGGSQGRCS